MKQLPRGIAPVSGRVLLIAREFLPYHASLGGVLRVLKLAEFLNLNGFDVHILTARGEPISYFGYERLVESLTVHYVQDPLQVAATRTYLSRKGRNRTHRPPTLTEGVRGLAKAAIDFVAVPDRNVLMLTRYVAEASKLIEERKIDNVFVSSPPHSMQLVGFLLKKRYGAALNIIVDYRDSWNTTKLYRHRAWHGRLIGRALERKVLEACDAFTYVSEPMMKKVAERYFRSNPSTLTRKSRLMMNGFDGEAHASKLEPRDVLTIGYFGALTDSAGTSRDPSNLLKVLEATHLDVRLELHGAIDLDPAWSGRLGTRLRVHDSLAHEVAIRKMAKMDVLVLVHSETEGSDEVITGKFFEYLKVGRPIWVIGPPDMEAARLVEKHKLGYFSDVRDQRRIAAVLSEIHSDRETMGLPTYPLYVAEQFARVTQYSAVLELLRPLRPGAPVETGDAPQ